MQASIDSEIDMDRAQALQDVYIPSLRVKRPHKKSRSGCITCKARKVKCDERRPVCVRCSTRGLECAYGDAASGQQSASPTTSTTATASTTPSQASSAEGESPFLDESFIPQISETEITLHFFDHTAATLETYLVGNPPPSIWRELIPTLAYASSIVRNGMLAASAMCLQHHAETTGHTPAHLRAVAELYGQRALRECRAELRDIRSSNADALMACSRILALLGLTFFRTHRNDGMTLADAESWTWLHMMRGVQVVQTAVVQSGSPIDLRMIEDMRPAVPSLAAPGMVLPSTPGTTYQHPLLYIVHATRQKELPTVRAFIHNHEESLDPEEVNALVTAIRYLLTIYDHICSDEVTNVFRAIFSWQVSVPKEYVDLLTCGNIMALMVYAYWLMLVVLVEDLWWVDDMGRTGISEIVARCEEAGITESMLARPRQMLGTQT